MISLAYKIIYPTYFIDIRIDLWHWTGHRDAHFEPNTHNVQFVSRDRPHNDVPKYVDLNNGQSKYHSMCVSIACAPCHIAQNKSLIDFCYVSFFILLCVCILQRRIAYKKGRGSGFFCEGERQKKRANNKYFCNKFFNLVRLIAE